METKRPMETRRKKNFRGRGLWEFGCSFVGWFGCFGWCRAESCGDWTLSGVALSAGFSGGGSFLTGTMGVCFLWIWREHDGPGGRFVAAAAGGFVEAEGLEGAGEGEEEQGGSDEDADVEMDQAEIFQERVGRGHVISFLHKEMKYDKFSPIYLFWWPAGILDRLVRCVRTSARALSARYVALL